MTHWLVTLESDGLESVVEVEAETEEDALEEARIYGKETNEYFAIRGCYPDKAVRI